MVSRGGSRVEILCLPDSDILSLSQRHKGSSIPLPLSRAFQLLVKQASAHCILFKYVIVCSGHRPHSRAEHATHELGVSLGLGWLWKPEEELCTSWIQSGRKVPNRMQLPSPNNQPSGDLGAQWSLRTTALWRVIHSTLWHVILLTDVSISLLCYRLIGPIEAHAWHIVDVENIHWTN